MTTPSKVLVDSGFFFALFNPRDPHHADAVEKREWLEILSLVIPWPILYETLNTRLARRPATIARFESILRDSHIELLNDSPYRLDAYEDALTRAKTQRNAMSLVDSVICAILDDPNVRIDAMLTFNLRDFANICHSKGIELL